MMMDGSMMGWMWVWPVLVVLGLVLLGYITYQLSRRPATDNGGSSARQLLDERYARGEVDEEDYRQRRAALR